MQIAAAYIRVSTDDQLEYSPDSQLKLIRDYAKAHEMTVPNEFVYQDEGISGRRAEKRPAFQRMIGAAKAHMFDVILVYSLSRFARSREDSIVYKRMLRKDLGIDVISISQPLGQDKTSILIEAMLEAMDEYYSIDLAENVKRGMIEKASRGEPTGQAPYGYRVKDKKYVVKADEAEVVRMIYRDFAEGMGHRDIAVKLNAMGIKTLYGHKWESRTVAYILQNPAYVGMIHYDPNATAAERKPPSDDAIIVEGSHEHIIDDELAARVAQRWSEHRRAYSKYAHPQTAEPFVLQGVVKCSACGGTLSRTTRGENASLQCNRYTKGLCTASHSITVKRLEQRIIDAIEDDLLNVRVTISPPSDGQKTPKERELIEQRIRREENKLIRIRLAYEDGVDTLEEYKASKKSINDTIAQLKNELTAETPKLSKKQQLQLHRQLISQLKDTALDPAERNRVLKTIIKHAVYNRPSDTVRLVYR